MAEKLSNREKVEYVSEAARNMVYLGADGKGFHSEAEAYLSSPETFLRALHREVGNDSDVFHKRKERKYILENAYCIGKIARKLSDEKPKIGDMEDQIPDTISEPDLKSAIEQVRERAPNILARWCDFRP